MASFRAVFPSSEIDSHRHDLTTTSLQYIYWRDNMLNEEPKTHREGFPRYETTDS